MSLMSDDVIIRTAHTIEDCRLVQQLMIDTWGREQRDSVSATLLLALAHNRGTVLLARCDGEPSGFCFSFLSYIDDHHLKHHSQMTGVLPRFQNKRIGELLKWAQREQVLNQGIDLITWTYDPLETRNARLNIHKLGAVSNTYFVNLYGRLNDDLNRGTSTDRLQVDWWINSAHVEACRRHHRPSHQSAGLRASGAAWYAAPRMGRRWLLPTEMGTAPSETRQLLLAVPDNIGAIRAADSALAEAWREHVRAAMTTAFAAGLTIVDITVEENFCAYYLANQDNYEN